MALGEQRMVTIPTARDVAYADPRSCRIANAGPTPMVGAALADAGQAVEQASYSLQELAEREKIDVANDRSNAVSTSLTRFLADEEQRFLKAREDFAPLPDSLLRVGKAATRAGAVDGSPASRPLTVILLAIAVVALLVEQVLRRRSAA